MRLESLRVRALVQAILKSIQQFGRQGANKATHRIGMVLLIILSLLGINLVGCGGGNNEGGLFLLVVKSLTITPVNPTIANGTPVQLTATGIFFDNTVHDLTNAVQWVSTAHNLRRSATQLGARVW